MVNDSFVPSSKQPSVIYCRLTNFGIEILNYVNVTAIFQDSSFASISVINWKDGSEGYQTIQTCIIIVFLLKNDAIQFKVPSGATDDVDVNEVIEKKVG